MDKKTIAFAILLMVIGLFVLPAISLQFADREMTTKNNPVEKIEFFDQDTASYPTMLKAQGTKIVDANGKDVVLTGLSTPDPHRLYQLDKFSLEYYQDVFKLGGNAIRIPVNPSRYLADDYYMWRFLDPIVKWAGENNFYVILDWDCSGNPVSGEGENLTDISNHVEEKTNDFWEATAKHFKDTPNVVFEIYSEPEGIEAEKWAEITNGVISTIRNQGANQLIIVGSLNKGYDISWAKEVELDDDNVALAMHIYPDLDYESIITSYDIDMPLIVTAWGFIDTDSVTKSDKFGGSADSFGKPLMDLLNSSKISWIASCYDDKLEPAMFYKDTENLTFYGKFVVEQLK